jgi:hypothetical protein
MIAVTLTRIAAAAWGGMAIIWALTTLPLFWRSAPLEQIAVNIVGQVAYNPEKLADLLPAINGPEQAARCEPRALHNSAIIRLRQMEDSFRPDQVAYLDGRIDAVDKAIRRSLECSPADPFLWLVLFSVQSARNGFRSEYLGLISASYRLGPREGWIAVQRNRVVMAIFPMLPPDLAELAVGEFVELVANRLYGPSADVLLGPGWSIRDQLLSRLGGVAERERREFADELRARGSELHVPGVAPSGTRPWQ